MPYTYIIKMRKRSEYRKSNRKKGYRGRKVTVKENAALLPFLFDLLKEQSKSSVKSLLIHGQISLNGKVTNQFDTPLEPNDTVEISYERGKTVFSHPLLKIIWEDDDLIVVNKRNGLLSVANGKEKERTAYHLLSTYVKKQDPRNKIFILQRLGKDTSGLMFFAKNKGIQDKFLSNWNDMVTHHSYLAVVEGRPENESGLIAPESVMGEDNRLYVATRSDGGEAITRYKIIRSNESYSLLELSLEGGRKEDIRFQMYQQGHPIAGDLKYGAETNPEERMMLHAGKLWFIHPASGEEMRFETQIPTAFISITK